MKNKTVRMLLAVAVLAVLCGAYAGVKTGVARREQQEEEMAEVPSETVLEVNEEDVKSIGFMIDEKEAVFEKTNDLWIKQDEKEFPVNQTTMNSAVSSITSISTDRILENVENLEEYGLSEPSNEIKIKTDTETTLKIGDKNNSANQYYVSKDEEENTVYLVDSAVVEPFMNSLYDYAEKELFPAVSEVNTVSKIMVAGENVASYELEKDADTGLWEIAAGVNENQSEFEKADSAKASALASLFGSLTYDFMVDYNCTDKGEYGLEEPYAVITADYQEEVSVEEDVETETEVDAEKEAETEEDAESEMIDKQLIIRVGDEAANGGRYVLVNDSAQVYTIAEESLLEFLGKEVSDFWDLTVNYLSVNRLEKLDIEYGETSYEVNVSRETSKDEDGEKTEKITYLLDEKEVEKTDFTAFYNKLINMTGQRRLTESYSPTAKPEMTAVFTSDDGENTEVRYYAHDENYYVALVGEKAYLVNKMTVREMFTAFENLVQRI